MFCCIQDETHGVTLQCVSENWAEKLQSQSYEGCNIAGKLKVNKVVGNLHITPGRSFQSNSLRLHELVPYLQDGSRHHDFGHTIHHLSFENAKEDRWDSVEKTRVMREKLGIQLNPLDYYYAKVTTTRLTALESTRANRTCHNRRVRRNTCSNTSSRWSEHGIISFTANG
jgi:hypothetical protein